jgi:sec-independent protein translocase protein TatB
MQFFGVGPAELVVILIVALVFVGPERLPRLAADLARLIRELRQYTGGLAQEFQEVVKDIEQETADDRSAWREIGEGLTGATKSVTEALRAARLDAESGGGQTAAQNGGSATGVEAPTSGAADAPAWVDIPAPTAGAAPAAASPNGHATPHSSATVREERP